MRLSQDLSEGAERWVDEYKLHEQLTRWSIILMLQLLSKRQKDGWTPSWI